MSLPVISSRDCIRAPGKIGFYVRRQKGSHIILRRDVPGTTVVVPERKELPKGTLRNIIRQADLTVEEFTNLL